MTRNEHHIEYIDFSPDIDLYKKEIHYEILEEDAMQKADEIFLIAKEKLKPSFGGVVLPVDSFNIKGETASITVHGKRFEGPPVRLLKNTCSVVLYYATSGMQLDSLNSDSIDFMASFWIDCLKQQALFQSKETAWSYYKEAFGTEKISSINPGAGNIGYWDVCYLKPIFEILIEYNCISDIKLNDNMFMIPNKSICGILFPSENEFVTCSECNRENCFSRSKPFIGGKQ